MATRLSIDALRAERSARVQRGDLSGAALVSEVLMYLGAATPFMEAEVRRARPRGPQACEPLTPAQWVLLWSGRARDPFAALTSVLWPAVLAECSQRTSERDCRSVHVNLCRECRPAA